MQTKNENSMRLFWAAKIENCPECIELVREIQHKISQNRLKTTKPENQHLTLKFLGDCSGNQLPELIQIGKNIARISAPSQMTIKGLGTFGKKQQPSVLFLKTAPCQAVETLAARLETAHQAIGFPPENRPFRAHITLARIKHIQDFRTFKETLEMQLSLNFSINYIHLIKSRLNHSGPKYEILKSFPLTGSLSK